MRTGGTASDPVGCVVKAPSRALGTFLRSYPVGPRPPIGSGQPRAAGTGRGTAGATDPKRRAIRPSTWYSTICETYGLAQGRGRAIHCATRARGAITRCWPVAIAGTGDVLMARLRDLAGPTRARGGRPLVLRDDGGAGALRRVPGDNSRCGPTAASGNAARHRRRLPPDGCPLHRHHHPPEC